MKFDVVGEFVFLFSAFLRQEQALFHSKWHERAQERHLDIFFLPDREGTAAHALLPSGQVRFLRTED